MDYTKTLNLPDTNFPVKPEPAKTELEVSSIWKDLSIYERLQKLNKGKPRFVIHNPTRLAYGHVSIDDALSMILRDILVKYKLMSGFNVPHYPTWNCHTPAIEREALQLLEDEGVEADDSELRKRCQSICSGYVESQKEQFQRLGAFAYWDKEILSLSSSYESGVIEAFGELYGAGYLHRSAKPTRWCVECQTDLTEAEIEYTNRKMPSLYVKFPVIHGLEILGEELYIVVWINPPWTLAANTAIAVHPDHDYAAVSTRENGILIMSNSMVEDIMERKIGEEYTVVKRMKGLELDKIVYAHPFLERDANVVLDKRVSSAIGTGCVHISPRYSQVDHTFSQQKSSQIISAVDKDGQLTTEAGHFCGLKVFESGDMISHELEKKGCLLASEVQERPYPHCSHCKEPIITRIADKWVLDLNASNLRQKMLKTLEEVDWLTGKSRDTIYSSMTRQSDHWNISSRRSWGIPTPVFYCSKCNVQIDALESITASREMIGKRGVSWWLSAKPDDILPEDVVCSRCGGRDFRWEMDMLDADFISAMNQKVLSSGKNGLFQTADICLGSNGQSGKWLQFSFLPSMSAGDSPPFRSALIHGIVVDENGRKIPGSEDGGTSPQAIMDKFGTDIFRLWSISMDCKKNMRMSDRRLNLILKLYGRIRNVCRFMMSNLSDYDPDGDSVEYSYLQEIDQWALHRLAKFMNGATQALEDRKFHLLYRLLYDFCSVDMSSIYFSTIKRRLYTFPRWSSSRRAAQTAIYEILTSVVRIMAPVLSFTAEDIWQHIPGAAEKHPSVFLACWPEIKGDFLNDELEAKWSLLLEIRSEIYRSVERVRQEEGIKGNSQASIVLYVTPPEIYKLLDNHIDDLETIFMVSKVRLMPAATPAPDEVYKSDKVEGLLIEARLTTGEKCERCWIYSDTVGTNELYPTLCHRCIDMLEGGTYYI